MDIANNVVGILIRDVMQNVQDFEDIISQIQATMPGALDTDTSR